MNVTGIIMECNPFHEGHAHILKRARELTGAQYIVAAMSGDYVQRGEPAVFDKYVRAGQILEAGADLVLEIPMYAACSSAEYFAGGAVALLDRLGVVTDLCFGSESGDLQGLQRMARLLACAESSDRSESPACSEPPACSESPACSDSPSCSENIRNLYKDSLRDSLRSGMPFPAARSAALKAIFPEGTLPSSPNDVLGVEYCRALDARRSSIRPHALQRIDVPSASSRRKALLLERKTSSDYTDIFSFPAGADDFSPQLLYALQMQDKSLEKYADVSPDLANRIRTLLPRFRSFTQFTDLVRNRSLTRTRVSRALLHILLQMEKERLDLLKNEDYVLYARPLALNREAAPLFSAIRRSSSIPFLSRLSEAERILPGRALSFLMEELRSEDLYCHILAAAAGSPSGQPVPRAMQRGVVTRRHSENRS